MRKHYKGFAAVLACLLLTLTGCKSMLPQETTTFYVICKSQDAYSDYIKAGAMDAGMEMGINIVFQAPESEEQLGSQLRMIQEAADNKANAVILAPIDKEALNTALAQAKSAGATIMTIDSDVTFDGRLACISTQNYSASAVAARHAAEMLGGSGDIAIITHSTTAQTAQERCSGFTDELAGKIDSDGSSIPQSQMPVNAAGTEQTAGAAGFPGIRILEKKNGEGNSQLSCEMAKQLISENPSLKLIYTTNQAGTVGVCQAIEDLGAADRVQVVGFDYFDGADAYIDSGVLDAVMMQNPYNMGYLAVRYANKVMNGQVISKTVNTGVTLVTKDNYQDEDIRFLVDPTGI